MKRLLPCRGQLPQLPNILGLALVLFLQLCGRASGAPQQLQIGSMDCPGAFQLINSSAVNGAPGLALLPDTTYIMAAGVYNLSAALPISGRVCLMGPNAQHPDKVIINSSPGSRHLQLLAGGTLGVQGVTFEGSQLGGGIQLDSGSTLTASRTDFKRNWLDNTQNTPGGGALYVASGATAVINQAKFWQNSAANGNGGAIWSSGDLSLTNVTFTSNIAGNNSAPEWKFGSSSGGAVYSAGSLTVTTCTFKSNAADLGGAVAVISKASDRCAFSSSTFSRNAGHVGGGALYIGYVMANAAAQGYTGFNAPSCSMQGPTSLVYNAAGLYPYYGLGGAILIRSGKLTVSGQACFQRNSAGYFGGAIAVATVPGTFAPYDAISVEFQGPGDQNFGLNSAMTGNDIYVYEYDDRGQRSSNTYFLCSGQQPRLSGAYTIEGPVCAATCTNGDSISNDKCKCPAGLVFNTNECGCGVPVPKATPVAAAAAVPMPADLPSVAAADTDSAAPAEDSSEQLAPPAGVPSDAVVAENAAAEEQLPALPSLESPAP